MPARHFAFEVNKELLINIGYGVYARAKKSALSGNVIPEKPLPELAQEVLKKLGIKIIPTKAQKTYTYKSSIPHYMHTYKLTIFYLLCIYRYTL
jgi:hypothetical protein